MHVVPSAQHVLVWQGMSLPHMLSPPHMWPCWAMLAHVAGRATCGVPGVLSPWKGVETVIWPSGDGLACGGGGVSLFEDRMDADSGRGLVCGTGGGFAFTSVIVCSAGVCAGAAAGGGGPPVGACCCAVPLAAREALPAGNFLLRRVLGGGGPAAALRAEKAGWQA